MLIQGVSLSGYSSKVSLAAQRSLRIDVGGYYDIFASMSKRSKQASILKRA
jgi:hypothetical protein